MRTRKPPPEPAVEESPAGFRVRRDIAVGRHPLLTVFPGLSDLPTAERHEPDAARRAKLHGETQVEVVDEDMWMYVAPFELPKVFRRRWKPVVSPETDCIVVGQSHLSESPSLILFLDIFHELRHVQQRQAGRELWPDKLSYVERPTELEAYQFVVDEARRFGVSDATLREYLRVEWIDDSELARLYDALGVPAN
ncbi:MAG TPA: hypothetical protein VN864_05275 [Thermoplasmata archaeon]|nr:hypothetical protein [Thermoplasmata archaeon]